MIDVLIATAGHRDPIGLHHIHLPYEVHKCTLPGWSAAANKLLDEAAARGRDAIFIDDDIELLPNTFEYLEDYLPYADLFGFNMMSPKGVHLQGGAVFHVDKTTFSMSLAPRHSVPCHIPHVTASLMYIKNPLLKSKVRFPIWPGLQHEDIAYTLNAWLSGFKVAVLPSDAIHHVDSLHHGATKGKEPFFEQRATHNLNIVNAWFKKNDIHQHMLDGDIPAKAIPIARQPV